jgi:hypothetical protein
MVQVPAAGRVCDTRRGFSLLETLTTRTRHPALASLLRACGNGRRRTFGTMQIAGPGLAPSEAGLAGAGGAPSVVKVTGKANDGPPRFGARSS